MKKLLIKASLVTMLAVPLSAIADPITYDITFTAVAGEAPTSGEFTYDADTQTLAGLEVIWNSITFANIRYFDSGCGAGGAGLFALLTQNCGTADGYDWEGDAEDDPDGGRAGFTFAATPGALAFQVIGDISITDSQSRGTWATARRPTAVPEPGTLGLLGLGLAGMGFARRRKTTQV